MMNEPASIKATGKLILLDIGIRYLYFRYKTDIYEKTMFEGLETVQSNQRSARINKLNVKRFLKKISIDAVKSAKKRQS